MVVLGFVLFRADSLALGLGVLGAMLVPSSGAAAASAEILSLLSPVFWLAFGFGLLTATPVFRRARTLAEGAGRASLYDGLSYAGSMLLFALSVLTLVSSSYNPFIYFRF